MSVESEDNKIGINPLLNNLRDDMEEEKIVAFLGPTGSGKTVISILINDTLSKHFLKHYDTYRARTTGGWEFVEMAKKEMLAGNFPTTTLPNSQKEITLEIENVKTLGRKISLKIRDMSGEDYKTLLTSDELDAEERINRILRLYKNKNMKYGPLAYILIAKLYVIVIDCSKYSKWEDEDLNYAHLLDTLLKIQETVNKNKAKTISLPIAIILSKTDRLDDENIHPKDLVASKMNQFDESLKMIHSGKREYFKLNIETNRASSNEPNPNKIKIPWKYSHDEYVRLIHWILENAGQ